MQNFVSQAETIVEDAAYRKRIIANAKAYVESHFNATAEFQAYSKIAGEMYKPLAKEKDKVSGNGDDLSDAATERKVRFVTENTKRKAKATAKEGAKESTHRESLSTDKPKATEKAGSSRKQNEEQKTLVENKTWNREPEGNADTSLFSSDGKTSMGVVNSSDGEKKTPETSQTSSKPDSTSGKDEQQVAKTDSGEDRPTEKDDGAKRSAATTDTAAASTKSSPRSPKAAAAAAKSDARKRITDSPSRSTSDKTGGPRVESGKGGGTKAGNGQKQTVTRVLSDSTTKLRTTATTKKTPLHSTDSGDKTALKPTSPHRSRSGSDTKVASRPSSRTQKSTK